MREAGAATERQKVGKVNLSLFLIIAPAPRKPVLRATEGRTLSWLPDLSLWLSLCLSQLLTVPLY